MRDIPAAVRAKALDAGASAWLTELPRLIDGLCREWGLRPGVTFGDATEAYVVSVTRNDGTPAVLKVLVPRRSAAAAHEMTVLRLAAGDGCCRLYEYDEGRGALLLEHLGPSMADLNIPQPRRLEILTDLASALWRPTGADLPTAVTRAEWQASYIPRKWSELGKPCSAAAVDQALAAAESRRRAWNPARAVLIHGDVHQWNALSVPALADEPSLLGRLAPGDDPAEAAFRLVDPDGLIAEPECDLGVLMREDPVELMESDPWDRARWLAARTGTDPQAIWEWGLVERVTTGLVLTVAGVQPVAAQMLAAADYISRR
ncbi:aminoglycoside phosphotransferase family protein [Actinoplanes sp. NPDC026619]|uniref:aminoglycoside phosphotransferase family protein n=1 Tax=Actinoplanes sp. NPDC026619 TaxID=3155798 RepID=UPI003406171C